MLELSIKKMSGRAHRKLSVTRTRLGTGEPLPPFNPEEALRQVERLRLLQAELNGVPLGRIKHQVQRRALR